MEFIMETVLSKALHRYERERKLSFAIIRELKKHGLRAQFVGKPVNETTFRFHPVSILIERRIAVLVRVGGALTEADQAWRSAYPGSVVLSGLHELAAALPALQARAELDPIHPQARTLAPRRRIQSKTD